jgi:hypothetical protein
MLCHLRAPLLVARKELNSQKKNKKNKKVFAQASRHQVPKPKPKPKPKRKPTNQQTNKPTKENST